MRNLRMIGWMLLLPGMLTAGSATAVKGASETIRPIPDVPRTMSVSVPHKIVPVINFSGIGKVELNITAHQIIFTDLGDNGGMHIRLFRNEEYERLSFSVVHTVRKTPYVRGVTYKLLLAYQEKFIIVYFREYEGKVTVKNLFD